MSRLYRFVAIACVLAATVFSAAGAEWPQFRGPEGNGVSDAKDMPLTWSAEKGIAWQTDLPGPGASSPVYQGDRIYVTCYSGMDRWDREMPRENLKLHVVCVSAKDGKILWTRQVEPKMPQPRGGMGGTRWHGYASSTPVVDDKGVYAYFDKTGVIAFDHDGNKRWQVSVGDGTHNWGCGASPADGGDRLIVNASLVGGAVLALDKRTGQEIWKHEGVAKTWGAPKVIEVDGARQVVLMVNGGVMALDFATGEEVWKVEGMRDYVCNTPLWHDGVLYCASKNTHGGSATLAVKPGSAKRQPEVLWRVQPGPAVSSAVYGQGLLYFTNINGRTGKEVMCLDADSGQTVYQEKFDPMPEVVYASPLLVDGKLYYVSQKTGVYVVSAGREFKVLAHNTIADDESVFNASPAPMGDGKLLLRSDKRLYCITGQGN